MKNDQKNITNLNMSFACMIYITNMMTFNFCIQIIKLIVIESRKILPNIFPLIFPSLPAIVPDLVHIVILAYCGLVHIMD